MPIYEYRCENNHLFEVMQSMSDDPIAVCPQCGAPVERVFHPVAVHFKGSGFYTTDYGRGRSAASGDSGGGDSGSSDSAKSSTGTSGSSDSGSSSSGTGSSKTDSTKGSSKKSD
jgi:putative FmdB family regulatory protein